MFRGQTEVPYAITVSQAAEAESDPARVVNLVTRGGQITFDLEMPQRAYSGVVLDLDGRDFIARARVEGGKTVGGARTLVASGTLFDLSSQHLSRSTSIAVGEVTFPVLHVELTVTPAPGGSAGGLTTAMVRGASVPPSREAQTVYTSVAESLLITRGRESVASFQVPMRVPVEQVSFVAPAGYSKDFSREVRVTALPNGLGDGESAETVSGVILSVKTPTGIAMGHRAQVLSIPATLGANLQSGATVEVSVENGDDAPVPFTAVRLEMRQREICFDGGGATLFYGDAGLANPAYHYVPAAAEEVARLGAEESNAAFVPRRDERSYTERHPELMWVVLLGVVCVLGLVALRSARGLRDTRGDS
jgi:hypothetical protein